VYMEQTMFCIYQVRCDAVCLHGMDGRARNTPGRDWIERDWSGGEEAAG